MTPQETDPDLPVNVQESLAEAWVGGGRPWPAAGLGNNMKPFEGGQQKQYWELTMAQIMDTLLPNSDLN